MEYDMRDFMRSCVDRYLEVTGTNVKSLRRAETTFLVMPGGGDTPPEPEKADDYGELSEVASSVLMKLLYGARMARWDLLRAIGILSSRVTKWTKDCDISLHRLMCYVNTTVDFTLTGYVGECDRFEDLHLALFADADLAGDRPGFKSTMGNYAVLQGPATDFAFGARSKSIGGVCSSTPEAELAAANAIIKGVGMPTLDLMVQIRGTKGQKGLRSKGTGRSKAINGTAKREHKLSYTKTTCLLYTSPSPRDRG